MNKPNNKNQTPTDGMLTISWFNSSKNYRSQHVITALQKARRVLATWASGKHILDQGSPKWSISTPKVDQIIQVLYVAVIIIHGTIS